MMERHRVDGSAIFIRVWIEKSNLPIKTASIKHMLVDADFEFDCPKFIWSHQSIIYILGFSTELVSQPGNLPTFKFLDRIFSPSFH